MYGAMGDLLLKAPRGRGRGEYRLGTTGKRLYRAHGRWRFYGAGFARPAGTSAMAAAG